MDKGCRRGGVGRLLYSELEEILKRQNVVSLNVCIAACDRENDAHLTADSLKFHSRYGFEESGRHHNCGYKFTYDSPVQKGPLYILLDVLFEENHYERIVERSIENELLLTEGKSAVNKFI